MRPSRKSIFQAGFTLLELLVVISIIAILVGFASVAFTTAQQKGRDGRRQSDMRAVQDAFEQYYAENTEYAECETMALGNLPGGLPQDPRAGTLDYQYDCASTSNYCVCAELEATAGNSDDDACDFNTGGDFFCVTNLQ